ncbi:hypothetical protein HQN90_12675 [Paenibacillus alba]|uniref:hypothetical protein n=1 Tax=Paenibacillus alba TaxID=1197127 RepID=UPI00156356E5|nr:hypothetical protein [Paenibacillus alba]NQX66971.1 hypothetical protein [Paenibacillus alba]
MKNRTTTGKIFAFMGIFIFALGFAFNRDLGIIDTLEPYSSLSIPLIAIGIISLISSNFFKKKK